MALSPIGKDTSDLFEVTQVNIISQTVASGNFQISQSLSKSGYTPIGVTGFGLSRYANMYYTGVSVNANSVYIIGANATGSSQDIAGNVWVLWKRNS